MEAESVTSRVASMSDHTVARRARLVATGLVAAVTLAVVGTPAAGASFAIGPTGQGSIVGQATCNKSANSITVRSIATVENFVGVQAYSVEVEQYLYLHRVGTPWGSGIYLGRRQADPGYPSEWGGTFASVVDGASYEIGFYTRVRYLNGAWSAWIWDYAAPYEVFNSYGMYPTPTGRSSCTV